MSELKAYRFLGQDEVWPDANLGSDYYLKSEADNVIAEKDAEIVELKKQVHDYAQGLYVIQARAEKEARHQKYKRCLDKAALCERKRIDAADYRIPREKWDFYDKWHRRWLELAEKLKEAK